MRRNKSVNLMKMLFGLAGILITIITTLLVSTPVMAQIEYSQRELALLPEYCKYTQLYRERVPGIEKAKVDHWYAVFGGSPSTSIFHAMHHYCWGLTQINYAKFWVTTPHERKFRWESSINEFDFMISSSKPGEKMLPEFHTKKGESLLALSRAPLAIIEFERAIELKPDYWPPYAAMSDYYKSIGNIKLAREILERGLSSLPDAKALARRLAELGGAKGKPNATTLPAKKPEMPKQPAQENAPEPTQKAETDKPPAEK